LLLHALDRRVLLSGQLYLIGAPSRGRRALIVVDQEQLPIIRLDGAEVLIARVLDAAIPVRDSESSAGRSVTAKAAGSPKIMAAAQPTGSGRVFPIEA
jgi:hypothetical protein